MVNRIPTDMIEERSTNKKLSQILAEFAALLGNGGGGTGGGTGVSGDGGTFTDTTPIGSDLDGGLFDGDNTLPDTGGGDTGGGDDGGETPPPPTPSYGNNILPNLATGWTLTQNTVLNSINSITINAQWLWDSSEIYWDIQPNQAYRLQLSNVNNGIVCVYELNSTNQVLEPNGNIAPDPKNTPALVYTTASSVDQTFMTTTNTGKLRIILTNGDVGLGSFTFDSPTLVTANGTVNILKVANLAETHSTSSATLTYTIPEDAKHLNIYKNGVLVGSAVTTSPWNDAGLTASTSYDYRVGCVDENDLEYTPLQIRATTDATVATFSSLKVSGRSLVLPDGTPKYMVVDTAWNLLIKLNLTDIGYYLDTRKSQGFNAVMINLSGGLVDVPAANGQIAVVNNEINPSYFAYVDSVLDLIKQKEMYAFLLPIWGDNDIAGTKFGDGNGWLDYEVVGLPTAQTRATQLGNFLGNRYKTYSNVVWVNGGDINLTYNGADYNTVFDALATAIKAQAPTHLMTFHPRFYTTETNGKSWIDFYMVSSGHYIDKANYTEVLNIYNFTPAKPVVDGEPRYEGITDNGGSGQTISAFDTRQAEYWAALSGSFGSFFGNNSTWQIDSNWRNALNSEGATNMTYLKRLMTSRPFYKLVPDSTVLVSANTVDGGHIVSALANDASYAYVYVPYGGTITVDLNKITGTNCTLQWYNPRTGVYTGTVSTTSDKQYNISTPANGSYTAGQRVRGNDFVLVIDNDTTVTPSNPPASGTDLLPNLNEGVRYIGDLANEEHDFWQFHTNTVITGTDSIQIVTNNKQWQNTWITIPSTANSQYRFTVENPNQAVVYIYLYDESGNQLAQILYRQDMVLDVTFGTISNTAKILIAFSNGYVTTGTFDIKNPTLIKL